MDPGRGVVQNNRRVPSRERGQDRRGVQAAKGSKQGRGPSSAAVQAGAGKRSSERRGPRGIRIWEGSGRRGVQAAEGSKGKVHVGDGHRRGRGEAQAGERSRQKGSRESEWNDLILFSVGR